LNHDRKYGLSRLDSDYGYRLSPFSAEYPSPKEARQLLKKADEIWQKTFSEKDKLSAKEKYKRFCKPLDILKLADYKKLQITLNSRDNWLIDVRLINFLEDKINSLGRPVL
jgi:hypothetical protein